MTSTTKYFPTYQISQEKQPKNSVSDRILVHGLNNEIFSSFLNLKAESFQFRL